MDLEQVYVFPVILFIVLTCNCCDLLCCNFPSLTMAFDRWEIPVSLLELIGQACRYCRCCYGGAGVWRDVDGRAAERDEKCTVDPGLRAQAANDIFAPTASKTRNTHNPVNQPHAWQHSRATAVVEHERDRTDKQACCARQLLYKYSISAYDTIRYDRWFAPENWQASCQFYLAHELKEN